MADARDRQNHAPDSASDGTSPPEKPGDQWQTVTNRRPGRRSVIRPEPDIAQGTT